MYNCTDLGQSQLETVVPRDNATHIMIVSGKHRAQVSSRVIVTTLVIQVEELVWCVSVWTVKF